MLWRGNLTTAYDESGTRIQIARLYFLQPHHYRINDVRPAESPLPMRTGNENDRKLTCRISELQNPLQVCVRGSNNEQTQSS